MTENQIATIIVDASLKIHRTLGPGLLESVYEAALAYELVKRGLGVKTQDPLPVIYDDVRLDVGFRPDVIVNDRVIVEIKSVATLAATLRYASGAANQFQCGADPEWNSQSC